MDIRNKLVFCIVLYKQTIEQADTYRTLISSFLSYSRCPSQLNIIIYDNTPNVDYHPQGEEILEVNASKISINRFASGLNDGLANAYNKSAAYATYKKYEWIVFLDQDTNLPQNFYEQYVNIDGAQKMYIPRVMTKGYLMSPSKYRHYRSSELKLPSDQRSIEMEGISFINSGILINLGFFNDIGGYNEELFLDFCDHDLVARAKLFGLATAGILDVTLEQDFSAHTNTKKADLFRYAIFMKDLKVFYKGKMWLTVFSFVDLPHLLSLSIRHQTFAFFKHRFLKSRAR